MAAPENFRFPYPAFKESAALRVPKDRADFHFSSLTLDERVRDRWVHCPPPPPLPLPPGVCGFVCCVVIMFVSVFVHGMAHCLHDTARTARRSVCSYDAPFLLPSPPRRRGVERQTGCLLVTRCPSARASRRASWIPASASPQRLTCSTRRTRATSRAWRALLQVSTCVTIFGGRRARVASRSVFASAAAGFTVRESLWDAKPRFQVRPVSIPTTRVLLLWCYHRCLLPYSDCFMNVTLRVAGEGFGGHRPGLGAWAVLQ